MSTIPFYFVVKPQVTLPYSIYERDVLGGLTSLNKTQLNIFLDSFGDKMSRLCLFHYVLAVRDGDWLTDLEEFIPYAALNSQASEYRFITLSLKQIFDFVTTEIALNYQKLRYFSNWLYQSIKADFPDLFNEYTLVIQKDKTFTLQKSQKALK